MKIGDKILFKHSLEKWRAEKDLPLLSQNSTTDSQDPSSQPSSSSLSEFESEKPNISVNK